MDSLTEEQRAVFHHLLRGENLFLTGGGGVGKSFLLSVIATELPAWRKKWEGRVVNLQMCAMTGCAALLLGHRAKTLHSWSGIGLGKGTVRELFVKIRKNGRAMRNWLSVDMLIIDEVSMLTAELLDNLNALAKMLRKNDRPFGGIQLLLVGDFYQLPPIRKGGAEGSGAPLYAFEAECWPEVVPTAYELTVILRQREEAFQRVLMEARRGELSAASCAVLKERWEGHNWRAGKIRPTLLFPRRAEVDTINEANFRSLLGRKETYEAKLVLQGKAPIGFDMQGEAFLRAVQQFDSDAPYVTELDLVEEAQVMLIANIEPEAGLVNGSRGVIIGFCPATGNPIVEFMNGRREVIGRHAWPIEEYHFVSRTQIPLRLAYAFTIHKSQGSSVDCALVDIGSGNFEFGQAYVALSRVRSLEALYIYDFEPRAFRAHPRVKAFYQEMRVLDIRALQEVPRVMEEKKEAVEAGAEVAQAGAKAEAEAEVPPGNNWLYSSLPADWKEHLEECEEALGTLSVTLESGGTFLPPRHQIWAALEQTPLASVRVVLLGQDPYPTPGHAHGLSFSVEDGVRPLPPSLQNIRKELAADVGAMSAGQGSLAHWAQQGVLLLNTVLTVEPGKPQSHAKIGWEAVTDCILRVVAEQGRPVFFVFWGKSAQAKKKLLPALCHHRIHESAHPSPLSAHKGFFGSRPFSAIQQWLKERGEAEIQW
jgi:ATP-dependent DNA helicase PIF1